MLRARLAHFHLELSVGVYPLEPRIVLESHDGHTDGFIEALGVHDHRMAHAFVIVEAHFTPSDGHGGPY
jgi:hypothetical protein